MKYIAQATVKTKIVVGTNVKPRIDSTVTFPVLTTSCPQYNLIDGGTPSYAYVPIGSFDLISGGNP